MNIVPIAREIAALAQTGRHFTENPYDRERYERLQQIAAEMLASSSNLEPGVIHEWNKAEFGYATPKVDVRAFVLREGRVLLVRENSDGGRWTLPGGWADVNQAPSESAAREVMEESGYTVRVVRLLAVWDRDRRGHTPPHPYHVFKIFFLCELTGGEPRPNLESSECGFFDVNELPELSLARTLESEVRTLYEMVQTGDTEARFD
ncbi:MAG: NUDIX hydrolase [Kiritimatiellae bacterium]|nr:NUDIX hydrolase [Kiritimatiellia bacterium]